MATMTGKRGCGFREPGGIYLETLLSRNGRPIEDFLIDPPVAVEHGFGLPDRGVLIMERPDGSGINDVYDHVGSTGYENVADFIEEVRRMGLSRRISRTEDLAKLTPGSRIFLAHKRAIIENSEEYYANLRQEQADYPGASRWICPCTREGHIKLVAGEGNQGETCAGLWYNDVTGGDPSYDPDQPPRTVRREVGSSAYSARSRPEGLKPKYRKGFFLNLPLHRLAVITDPEGGKDEASLEKAGESGLPVELEDA